MKHTQYWQSLQRQIAVMHDKDEQGKLFAEQWESIEIHHRLAAIETYLDIRDSLAHA